MYHVEVQKTNGLSVQIGRKVTSRFLRSVLFCAKWQGSSIYFVLKTVLFCAKWQKRSMYFVLKKIFCAKWQKNSMFFVLKKVLFCAKWQGSSMKEIFKIVLSCAKWQESCRNFRIPQFKSFNPVLLRRDNYLSI